MNSSHPIARDSNLPNFFRALLFLQHGFLAREDPKFPNSGIRREAPRSGQFLDFFYSLSPCFKWNFFLILWRPKIPSEFLGRDPLEPSQNSWNAQKKEIFKMWMKNHRKILEISRIRMGHSRTFPSKSNLLLECGRMLGILISYPWKNPWWWENEIPSKLGISRQNSQISSFFHSTFWGQNSHIHCFFSSFFLEFLGRASIKSNFPSWGFSDPWDNFMDLSGNLFGKQSLDFRDQGLEQKMLLVRKTLGHKFSRKIPRVFQKKQNPLSLF